MKRFLCTCVPIVFGLSSSLSALEGMAYFLPLCGAGSYRVYRSNLGTGESHGMFAKDALGGVRALDLSPDGQRMAMGVSGSPPSIWTASTDGSGLRKLAGCPFGFEGFAYTDMGIFWSKTTGDHNVMLTDIQTGHTRLAYDISEASPLRDMPALMVSNDGRHHIAFTARDYSPDFPNDPDHATRGPLMTLDANARLIETRWFNRYEMSAHGYGMSARGNYLYLVPFNANTAIGYPWLGYHGTIVIRRWSDGGIEACFVPMQGQTLFPSHFEPTRGFHMATCRNSDDYFAVAAMHPDYECQNIFQFVNWRLNEITLFEPDTSAFPYYQADIHNDSLFYCVACLSLSTFWVGTGTPVARPAVAPGPASGHSRTASLVIGARCLVTSTAGRTGTRAGDGRAGMRIYSLNGRQLDETPVRPLYDIRGQVIQRLDVSGEKHSHRLNTPSGTPAARAPGRCACPNSARECG